MAERITLKWLLENWSKTEHMVPMRDGTRLYTAVYQRKGLQGRHPVMLIRTPFSLKPYGKGFSRRLRYKLSNYVRNDYIIVFQNVRGTYLSEGIFENVRPGSGEADDSWDTAQWILSGTPCNGRIGVQGMSYPGFYATVAATCGHPAIKAVSPQAPVTDWFMGDDLHHNGAPMLADTCGFGNFFFKTRRRPSGRSLPCKPLTDSDLYAFYKGLTAEEIFRPFARRKGSFWDDLMEHPSYDSFWKERNAALRLEGVKPAMLVVGGLFDAEDSYGPLECYRRLKAQSPDTDVFMCLGPWSHGAWLEEGFDRLGDSFMGSGLTDYYLDRVEYPFFAYYLEEKGCRPGDGVTVIPSAALSAEAPAMVRQAGEIAVSYGCWPPEGVQLKRLYPAVSGGRKSLSDAPSGEEFRYVSDPDNPVPYFGEEGSWVSRDHMAADQRFLRRRGDVLGFSSGRLAESLRIAGPLKVHLEVAVQGDDADFMVKLIDVREDGYRMLVRGDMMPARFRSGFSESEPLVPGERTVVEFVMNDVAHEFLPGHRIMLQVQSSSFPLFAMNPQVFTSNPYAATEYRKAEITVFGTSYIELPVL